MNLKTPWEYKRKAEKDMDTSPISCIGSVLCLFLLSLVAERCAVDLTADIQYHESYAQSMMHFSAGAYAVSPDECIARAMPAEEKWEKVVTISKKCDILNHLCSFYIAASDVRRELVVVFRGTKTTLQLIYEAISSIGSKVNFFPFGKVNGYFYNGLKVLWDSLVLYLTDIRYEDYNITYTGHSLGGALASLAAFRTVADKFRRSDQVKVYTFGAPRVGSSSFAFQYDQLVPHSFRIVNKDDIVPRLPPCIEKIINLRNIYEVLNRKCRPETSGIAYHHGTEIWYRNGMQDLRYPNGECKKYKICKGDPQNEDPECSAKLEIKLREYEKYFETHRHYFGHKIPAFGKLGCEPNKEKKEEELPNDAITANDAPKPTKIEYLSGLVKNVQKPDRVKAIRERLQKKFTGA